MNTSIVKITHAGLASRSSAAQVRNNVEERLRQGGVIIDLSDVSSISSSYADELFGILAQRHSLRAFADSIELVGASASVITEIATAIQYRLNKDAGDQKAADRAARKVLSERDSLVAV